jgi:26S proteasome regulatory subunit N1
MELAPSFYHYLVYTMLKYRYSTRSKMLPSNLMGISLELPSSRLIDAKSFKQPDIDNTQFSNLNTPDTLPMLLWQMPNTNAALYFGDKWAELHSFLARRLATKADSGTTQDEKIISKRYPAIMEHLLELLRARGYYLLYPAFTGKGRFSLATFHNELFQIPEEFTGEILKSGSSEGLRGSTSSEKPLSEASTLTLLLNTFSPGLPDISRLPLLSYNGEEMSENIFSRHTADYLKKFRIWYGGCPEDSLGEEMNTERLFCEE